MRIYNTLTRQKETFRPIKPGSAKIYVCGPTVYDESHIGHARSVVVFDVVVRYLRFRGLDVTYVRNFTDVDDKIISRANEQKMAPDVLAEKYIARFHEDMDALGVDRPTFEPRATEHIDHMIRFIQRLIEKGHAYVADNDVFYAVDGFDEYGKLSGRKLEDMDAGARVEVDARKINPQDFALWKAAKPGEPFWESPWGNGRPGWHIECSAMSSHLLGETFDIHGGGKDLIFPHHENEIAQSEGLTGNRFAKLWMHNGFVNIDQEKMSKSLGNTLLVKNLLKSYPGEVLRLFLLSNHYRSPIDFTDQNMIEAENGLEKIYVTLNRIETAAGRNNHTVDAQNDLMTRFQKAMDDDFNTALAIGLIFETVRGANRLLDGSGARPNSEIRRQLKAIHGALMQMGMVLGLMRQPPADYLAHKKKQAVSEGALDAEHIEQLIRERIDARVQMNWAEADRIRNQLQEMGVLIEDRPDGTHWKVASSV